MIQVRRAIRPGAREALAQQFSSQFRVIPVAGGSRLDAAYRLRHQVCNEEFGMGLPSHQGYQRDEFDRHARHLVLEHDHEVIGTARLIVLPAESWSLRLPFTLEFAELLDRDLIDPDLLPTSACCELSRLVIDRRFRRRPGEETSMNGVITLLDAQDPRQRLFPFITVGLVFAAMAHFIAEQRSLLFFAAEPRLARRLSQLGVNFTQASEQSHTGHAVYFATRDSLMMDLRQLRHDWYDLYETVDAQLKANTRETSEDTHATD